MTRTHRGLLIVLTLATAACGGSDADTGSGRSATPSADPPADATPWQARDTTPRDSGSVRR